jgi:hypothetical protein
MSHYQKYIHSQIECRNVTNFGWYGPIQLTIIYVPSVNISEMAYYLNVHTILGANRVVRFRVVESLSADYGSTFCSKYIRDVIL